MRGLGVLAVMVLTGPAAWAEALPIVRIEAGADRLDVAAAQILKVEVQHEVGGPRVVVTLDPELAVALGKLTTDHVRQEVAIRVCGQVVSRPTLWAPVMDGVFAVQGDDMGTAQRLAAVLQAKDCAGMVLG